MRYLLLCFTLLMLSCSDDDSDVIGSKEERMAQISANVEALIANKSCNGVDDCASIAWGAKPCGGPWGYLVYSPGNVDVPQLEELTEEYNRLEEELNQIKGLASDCALVTEPDLQCLEEVCVAEN